MSDKNYLWEILVPTERPKSHKGKHRFFRKRFHRIWDERVRSITGGLTIFGTTKGSWTSPSGELFEERMIPVRIMATANQIEQIANLTAKHYEQLAIMYYRVSDEVFIVHYHGVENAK